MSIRKVVAGLLITAGIAIMAVVKKLLASSMGSNEKVNSNKLFCTLKISKDLIEYVQKKIKFFLSQS